MSRFRRLLGITIGGVVLAGAAIAARPVLDPYQPEPWLADYAQLKQHMEAAYANLEWSVAGSRVDIAGLDAETRSALQNAGSDRAARAALVRFVAAFKDPHFHASRPAPGVVTAFSEWWRSRGGSSLNGGMTAGQACGSLGYSNRGQGSSFAFGELPGASSGSADNAFPLALVPMPDGRTLAVLRIGHFGEDGYRNVCEAVWAEHDATVGADCDDDCAWAFQQRVRAALLADIRARAAEATRAGAAALLVDISGNGGGSNFADLVARTLTPLPLRIGRSAMVRHPHSVEMHEDALESIDADIANSNLSAGVRDSLRAARAAIAGLAEEARRPCDTSSIWTGDMPACSQLVTDSLFGYLPPGALAGAKSRGWIFGPLSYEYTEGTYDGPLLVLTDGGTASASEQFASLLRDNNAAVVLGTTTFGAGCGYVNGPSPLTLEHSGLVVWLPNCVRYRASGENELLGVEPDHPAPWDEDDDGNARAAKVVAQAARVLGG